MSKQQRVFTSAVRIKMALNNGVMPPMTPLSEKAKRVCDPRFVEGMGGLREDERRGLQCPRCGEWYHRLGHHIANSHPEVGTAGIKEALQIPAGMPLISAVERARNLSRPARKLTKETAREKQARIASYSSRFAVADRPKRKKAIQKARRLAGRLNYLDWCEQQITEKLAGLATSLKRVPNIADFQAAYGEDAARRVVRLYGSINVLAARFGEGIAPKLLSKDGKFRRDYVLDVLYAWYKKYGELPAERDSMLMSRVPVLPKISYITKALGTANWDSAMQRAAALLNIYGGRYGLSEKMA